MTTPPLVDPTWLSQHLARDDVRVVDGSWYLPSAGRDPRAEYAAGHIPGAVFVDIDAVSDPRSPLPHMLSTPEAFEAVVGALGISNEDHVVVYDGAGLFSAARAWWTFRVFGHDRVSVLNGGLPAWTAAGHSVESTKVTPPPRSFRARKRPELVRTLEQMRSTTASVVDARGRGRFEGTAPEPRAGLRSGHIPGSVNVPYTDLVKAGALRPPADLAAAFAAAGVDVHSNIEASCGSGMTAAIIALALFVLGNESVAVYDGSWTEWGGRPDTPVETGPRAVQPG